MQNDGRNTYLRIGQVSSNLDELSRHNRRPQTTAIITKSPRNKSRLTQFRIYITSGQVAKRVKAAGGCVEKKKKEHNKTMPYTKKDRLLARIADPRPGDATETLRRRKQYTKTARRHQRTTNNALSIKKKTKSEERGK